MPYFNVDDVNISVDEFFESCGTREKEDLKDAVIEYFDLPLQSDDIVQRVVSIFLRAGRTVEGEMHIRNVMEQLRRDCQDRNFVSA